MSVWKPGSDIVRLNAAAGEHAVAVSADVREVLRAARAGQRVDRRQVRRHVRRAVGHLEVRSRPGQHGSRLPARSARGCRSSTTGRSTIDDARRHGVSRERKGMRVHLGGIGKGYAVDRAVRDPARARASTIS